MASPEDKKDYSRQSDVDLVRLCTSGGDRSAFAELVRRHGGTIRTHLRRMGAQGADADDMAQEAFMIGYERLADYRFDGPFIGWLKTIAARRYLKKVKSAQKYLLTDDMTAFEPEAPVQEGEFRAHNLDAALDHLKPVERLCLSLNFSGDLSHQDIADALKIPLGTVKSHIRRAMDRLKVILSPASDARPAVLETGS